MNKKINIEGMSCGHCVGNVKETLTALAIGEVEVNLEAKYAILATNASDDQLKEAIEDIGFDVVGIENV